MLYLVIKIEGREIAIDGCAGQYIKGYENEVAVEDAIVYYSFIYENYLDWNYGEKWKTCIKEAEAKTIFDSERKKLLGNIVSKRSPIIEEVFSGSFRGRPLEIDPSNELIGMQPRHVDKFKYYKSIGKEEWFCN